MASQPDLFVVCKNCGSEVSPYITECPYCGHRLRKRAPKIEKDGTAKRPRGAKVRKPPREPRFTPRRADEIAGLTPARPWVTMLLVGIPFAVIPVLATLLWRANAYDPLDLVLLEPLDGDYWRLISYSITYGTTGYELIALGAICLFGYLLERRHGFWAPLIVYVAGTVGGAGLALAAEDASFATGGNGAALALLCAWTVRPLLARRRPDSDDESDLLGVLMIALVTILLPVADENANWWVALGGALAGTLLGLVLTRVRAHR